MFDSTLPSLLLAYINEEPGSTEVLNDFLEERGHTPLKISGPSRKSFQGAILEAELNQVYEDRKHFRIWQIIYTDLELAEQARKLWQHSNGFLSVKEILKRILSTPEPSR